MAIKEFIAELWAAKLLTAFQKSLVFADVVNHDYEGLIKNLGDTVKISGLGPVTVDDYAGTVTYQTLESEGQILKIDKRKYFGFAVDDADAAQSGVTFMSEAMLKAAYGIKDVVDSYIAGFYSDAGNIIASTPINSLNILAALLTLGQALDEANVPSEGRWVVLPPWMVTKLVLAKLIVENTTNDAFTNGSCGRAAGFDIRKSNNVNNDGTTWNIMAGTNAAISYAGQIDPAKVEALRDKDGFNDYVRGEVLFGARVVQPAALAVLKATVLAEP